MLVSWPRRSNQLIGLGPRGVTYGQDGLLIIFAVFGRLGPDRPRQTRRGQHPLGHVFLASSATPRQDMLDGFRKLDQSQFDDSHGDVCEVNWLP